jgi:hypothetical protein
MLSPCNPPPPPPPSARGAAEERIIAGVTDVAFSRTGRILFASYDEAFCRAWETISKEGCVAQRGWGG